jgi:hypothetical protein
MKKIVIIIFAVVALGVGAAFAQNISPMELKNARLALLEWVSNYDNFHQRALGEKDYRALFMDDIYIDNDYLPLAKDNYGDKISISSYIKLVRSQRDGLYKWDSPVKDVKMLSEKLDGSVLKYELEIEKLVSFVKDTVGHHYEYPPYLLKYRIKIDYDINLQQAKATSVQLDDSIKDFIRELVVLHSKESNTYTTRQNLEKTLTSNVPMVTCRYESCDFDSRMIELQGDTMKWSMFVNATVGKVYYGQVINNMYSQLMRKSKLNYNLGLGVYRQLKLKGDNRLGLDFGLSYRQTNLNINNEYGERYAAVDGDAGRYERITIVTDYEENIKSYSLGIPVALRYDHFFSAWQSKQIAFVAKFGLTPMLDLKQSVDITADAQYSGYYDWLWGVTIDQNDIYDFGNYTIENHTENTAFDRFSLDVFAAIGVSCYVTKRLSFDLSAVYSNIIYKHVNYMGDYHLTNDSNDWHSATWMMKRYSLHSFKVMLQVNYNF